MPPLPWKVNEARHPNEGVMTFPPQSFTPGWTTACLASCNNGDGGRGGNACREPSSFEYCLSVLNQAKELYGLDFSAQCYQLYCPPLTIGVPLELPIMNTEWYKKMIMDLNMPPPMDHTTPQEETQQPDIAMMNQAPVENPAMTL
jgi:hypothetical protein